MVSLGKLKRESLSDHNSQEAEEELEEEPLVVKPREPLSGIQGASKQTNQEGRYGMFPAGPTNHSSPNRNI